MALDTLQGRPAIEIQASGLKKITRFKRLQGEGAKAANISSYAIAYGTADVEFTDAYLVDQRIERRSEDGIDLTLVQVFQQLANSALTATTEVKESTSFDKRLVKSTTYLCKASQVDALKPAIGSGSPAVFQVDTQINGPVASVVVSTINVTDAGFVLSQSDQTKNNGALLLRTIRTVGAAPATPSGYTLISPDTQNVDGYTVYSYTFAKGEGRISTDVAYKQNGKLKVTTIRYLDSDDGATPAGELVNDDSEAQEGYTIYTKGYAEIVGDGIVTSTIDKRENGKLVLYRITRLGTPPTAPAATISGTVVSTATDARQEDGFTLYDYQWAEGKGTISTDTRSHLNGAVTYTTIRSLGVAVVATGQFETSSEERDGHTLYVSRGIVINTADLPDEVRDDHNGALTYTTKRKINSAPTGTGYMTRDTADKADGYTLYTRTFVEGAGVISTTTQKKDNGIVVERTSTLLESGASAPALPTYLIAREVEQGEGHQIVTDTYYTTGTIGTPVLTDSTTRTRDDASYEKVYTYTGPNGGSFTPPAPSGYYLVQEKDSYLDGGLQQKVYIYIKPPATVTLKRTEEFPMPGLAEVSSTSGYVLSPPYRLPLLADVQISYGTSQVSDSPYYSKWSRFDAQWKRASDGMQFFKTEELSGYVGSNTLTVTNGSFAGVDVNTAVATVSHPDGTNARPTGTKVMRAESSIYLMSITGTVVYRNVVVSVTLP